VIATGATHAPGGPHAEIVALRAAGDARGATAYVSLEPCAHHGRTPPCADALVAAGVARVVVAQLDPFPAVDGAGVARLRAAGIPVDVAEADAPIGRVARRQLAGFRTAVVLGRPHVRLKAALTLDGRTATAAGDSRWISGPESRRLVHDWRADADAVLVGIGTALADDPLLTARHAGPPAFRQPLRVVFDRGARLPLTSKLAATVADAPVVVLCGPDAPAERRAALEAAGVETLPVGTAEAGLQALAARDVRTVLLEGGARLAAGLLADGLVDRLALFVAPILLGDAAAPGLAATFATPAAMADARRATSVDAEKVGVDILLDAWLQEPP
jgi:diaminohydroxyphosphoribosylaminopyrimidine deaminase/5-amino-6-(5-phosphoribosylamino)uracil reductase